MGRRLNLMLLISEPTENDEVVMTWEEAKVLWKWLKHQSLPYDNYELKLLAHELGNIVEPK